MSKAKLMAAQELIKEKRYDEARNLLRGIDHPTAEKWLGKLAEIAPEQAKPLIPSGQNVRTKVLEQNTGSTPVPWKYIGLIALVAIISVGILGIAVLTRSGFSNETSNGAFVGIWRNQNVYRATITYREDGTGVSNGVDPFVYKINEKIGDTYLVERTNTGDIFYGSTSIEGWHVLSETVMIEQFSIPKELYTPGMSLEELKQASDELDMQLWGAISDPVTWELVTRSTP